LIASKLVVLHGAANQGSSSFFAVRNSCQFASIARMDVLADRRRVDDAPVAVLRNVCLASSARELLVFDRAADFDRRVDSQRALSALGARLRTEPRRYRSASFVRGIRRARLGRVDVLEQLVRGRHDVSISGARLRFEQRQSVDEHGRVRISSAALFQLGERHSGADALLSGLSWFRCLSTGGGSGGSSYWQATESNGICRNLRVLTIPRHASSRSTDRGYMSKSVQKFGHY